MQPAFGLPRRQQHSSSPDIGEMRVARFYYSFMWVLVTCGILLSILATSTPLLAGGLLSLSVGTGGLTAGLLSGLSSRRHAIDYRAGLQGDRSV